MHTNLTRGHTPVFAVRMNKSMTRSETRDLVLKMMKNADLDSAYDRYAQKAKDAAPKHIWMLTHLYGTAVQYQDKVMSEWAEYTLEREGYQIRKVAGGWMLFPIPSRLSTICPDL